MSDRKPIDRLRWLELRVPPLVLVLVWLLLMWGSGQLLPGWPLVLTASVVWMLVIGLLLLGAAVAVAGVLAFRRHQTTVNPMTPEASQAMVCSGIYAFSRNAMYLGFLLMLGAWAVFLQQAVALVGLPLFVLYLNRFQIIPEERALAARFGAEFAAYLKRVRRWI